MELILPAFTFFVLIFSHEFGHYVLAKKRGVYKGWGFFPNPHIKLTNPYPHRLDYLSGFVASSVGLPFWILATSITAWYWYFAMMVGAALFDFLVIFCYSLLKSKPKQGITTNEV